ncbi:hydrogenase accessory protein HypB [Sphingobacteriales bacterium UPWRP_1]|nr:hydrogenase accessory protein HypB [Sphingobacteriales bacterium TSM_CSS]PSJ77602.1 hydrogenase accessory protein HypB [Sphingobacteriales bacterium UPWRP_1]
MCATCGCSAQDGNNSVTIRLVKPGLQHFQNLKPVQNEDHLHADEHPHKHPDHTNQHQHNEGNKKISLEIDVLAQNKLAAVRNRGFFEGRNMKVINLVSSPGSGKTTLLEKTLVQWKPGVPVYVIEGDQQTDNDARRIAKTGVKVVQINTGTGCHLDAPMISNALHELNPEFGSVLFIENVGNLVCPAMFDLGEQARVVIMSVTEGEDKPLKYPHMFHSSDICLINKTDLLPYVDFDMDKAISYVYRVSHVQDCLPVSATKNTGLENWYRWLSNLLAQNSSQVTAKVQAL